MSRMTWGVPSLLVSVTAVLSCVDIMTPRPRNAEEVLLPTARARPITASWLLDAWLLGATPRLLAKMLSSSLLRLCHQPFPAPAHSYSLASPNFARKFRFSKTRGTVDSLSMDKLYPDCLQLQCMMRIFSVWECASWELVLVSPQSAAADSISDNEAANNLFTLTTGHTHTNVVDI